MVALYAPHKGISINGLKFSVIVFDRAYQAVFEQWADVLYGPLNMANVAAAKHYLSDNFQVYNRRVQAEIAMALLFVREQATATGAGEVDVQPVGHFITFYCPRLPATLGEDEVFLWQMVQESGALVLPGTRNHFDPSLGLCFRINLTLDSVQFRAAVARLFRFLATVSSRG